MEIVHHRSQCDREQPGEWELRLHSSSSYCAHGGVKVEPSASLA